MTQGSREGDVTPGTWTFDTPTCNGAAVAVSFTVSSLAPAPSRFAAIAGTPDGKGYWLVQSGGGVFPYCGATFYGSLPGLGIKPVAPIVGIASTPDGCGYWLVGADGGVFAFGDAAHRDERQQRIAQHVAEEDPGPPDPLGPGGAHVVLVEIVDHRAADVAAEEGDIGDN